jgi:hypothetical protein
MLKKHSTEIPLSRAILTYFVLFGFLLFGTIVLANYINYLASNP